MKERAEDENEDEDEGCRLIPAPGAPGLPITFLPEQRRGDKKKKKQKKRLRGIKGLHGPA